MPTRRTVLDRLTAYSQGIVDGDVPAGKLMRGVAKRHLNDVRRSKEDPACWFRFNEERARKACSFLVNEIVIYDRQLERERKLKLLPWQTFAVGSLFGWQIRPGVRDPRSRKPGTRRFRKMTLMTGRASGKSVLMAGILNYCAYRLNKRTVGYLISGTEMQAGIILKYAVDMIKANPRMDSVSDYTKSYARQGGLIEFKDRRTGLDSSIMTLAGTGAGKRKSGFHPTILISDELQEHLSGKMRDTLRAGFADTREPLSLSTCNAGAERRGAWWDDRKLAERVCSDIESWKHDAYLPLFYEIDDDDNPIEEDLDLPGEYTAQAMRSWEKANPSYGHVVEKAQIKSEIEEALDGGSDAIRELYRAQFSRPRYGVGWIEDDQWEGILVDEGDRPPESVLREAPLWIGVDLAKKHDFTAIAKVWKLPDGTLYAEVQHYTGGKTLPEREILCQADFTKWAKDGHIKITSGNLLDYAIVAKDIEDLHRNWNLQSMACDLYEVQELLDALDALNVKTREMRPGRVSRNGLAWIDHLQGGKWLKKGQDDPLTFRQSLKDFESYALSDPPRIKLLADPVTSFCYTCVTSVCSSNPGVNEENKWLAKSTRNSQREKIDGVVALVMAAGSALYRPKKKKPNLTRLQETLHAQPPETDAIQ